eukprot:2585415-Rhodomonas_salina.2
MFCASGPQANYNSCERVDGNKFKEQKEEMGVRKASVVHLCLGCSVTCMGLAYVKMRKHPSKGFAYDHNVHKIDAWSARRQPTFIHGEHYALFLDLPAQILTGQARTPEL